MKRLCVFVTYDYECIVDGYVGYMLQGLRKMVDFLCVVCNYRYISSGLDNVQFYADRIFYRENMGFDAGAYKDVLCRYLGWNEVGRFDELILVNDSFYGPLYSLEKLFDKMDMKNVDYWGMTRCPEVELADNNTYGTHIQSYFLVLGKDVLQNKEFQKFWEEMEYPVSFMQTVITFEIGINKLLQRLGFRGIAAMDLSTVQWNLGKNQNPYILYPLELIRDADIPVLKRKSLSLSNKRFADALDALRFIKRECNYDVSLIENHLRRIGKGMNIMGVDSFYAVHPRIFIYGAGFYGKNIAAYFQYKGWNFEKFLVSDMAGQSGDCVTLAEADIKANDGIIIAVGNKKAFSEIVQMIEIHCGKEQIFNPDDVIW